ncbi:MAG: lysophospholipid acyltransferase family protein [Paracoccaceae bacterium]|nr:lysophospholipid acyltransferase family protein [Paracoccaceae bacterium]MDG2259357.1 lysophospholipid acyltransferase family protein [Paracoccaceae bacterium]
MTSQREVARDISYAHSATTKGGRAMVRVLENATGRIALIKRANGYEQEVKKGRDFWDVMIEKYGLSLEVSGEGLSSIPTDGPLILIANHPYGILDGLIMGHILSNIRGDFRILANSVFHKSETLNRTILPISFDETKEAVKQNLETRKESLRYLNDGGAIGIFPGGTVSTAAKPFSHPMDPSWRSFTARMVAKSNATVVPIYFDGHTSRLFQIASHLHNTLRLGLFIKEFKKRVDAPVKIVVGTPIAREELQKRSHDAREMMAFLRKSTYRLSPKPLKNLENGYEFENRYKN